MLVSDSVCECRSQGPDRRGVLPDTDLKRDKNRACVRADLLLAAAVSGDGYRPLSLPEHRLFVSKDIRSTKPCRLSTMTTLW